MQRRQFLSILLPALALSSAAARALAQTVSCKALGKPELAEQLKPFADAELGKACIGNAVKPAVIGRLAALCESTLAAQYRKQVSADYAQGATVMVDGWILSESEVAAQQLVYQYTKHQ